MKGISRKGEQLQGRVNFHSCQVKAEPLEPRSKLIIHSIRRLESKDSPMTYQVPSKIVSSLPIGQNIYEGKPRYSLFKKIDGRWFQVRTVSYLPEMACKVWAEVISFNPTVYSIRRASFDYNEAR